MALTNVKLASIAFSSSVSLWVTVVIHVSVSVVYSACSKFMYMIVESIHLCPKTYLTCTMSFVKWYSVVPFQCLNVWKWICFNRGFENLFAIKFLWFS